MAYTTINKPTDYFNTKLHTGTGAEATITGIGFQPDLVWSKSRSNVEGNTLIDGVRGAGNALVTNTTSAEATGETQMLKSFNSDGFVVGFNGQWNASAYTYVYWNWLAANGTASNTNGTITSTVSANTTSGFSIVSYTGNGSSGATIGHGLGVAPRFIVVKQRNSTASWVCYHASLGNTKRIFLNLTNASDTDTDWNNTTPTSNVFYVGNSVNNNASGSTYIAYCFAEKKGFSKFGSYTGNGSADGTFVYTGFKPAFLIVKRTDSGGYDWLTYDNKRQVSFNVIDDFLKPNLSDAETTGNANQSLDFLSNGVKFRGSGASSNASGGTYIYMAFAENPLVTSTGIPTTAR
jgi:hypothetical protein